MTRVVLWLPRGGGRCQSNESHDVAGLQTSMLLKAEATTATLCAGYTEMPLLGRLVVIALPSPYALEERSMAFWETALL